MTRADFHTGTGPTAAVARVLKAEPDAVVVTATAADGAPVVRALIAQGAGPGSLPIYGNDGLYDPGFAEDVERANPGAVAGLEGTVPASDPGGTNTEFDQAFGATGIDPFFSSYYYDCTILTALAALKAKSVDPHEMARAFPTNLKGKHDCATFAECKALLGRGKTIHYHGASSDFDEWDTSEPSEGAYDVWSYNPSGIGVLEGPESQITIP